MPVDPAVLAKAKEHIGRTGPELTWEVTRRQILRFAIAIGDENPLYRSDEYARQAGYPGIIAPPMFHCTMALPEKDLDDLEESGIPGVAPRFAVPTPGFPGAVAGGSTVEMGVPFLPGDIVTVQERVTDVYAKEGKRGPMIFIIAETTFTNQLGQVAVRERRTLIRHA